jgi:autotransporter translocation and assembly factor TamB
VVDIEAPWAATLIDTSLAATIRRERLGPQFESVFLDSLHIRGLELEMGSNVWLRSTEANIQLAGTARVNKEALDYILTGTLQAPRGVYRLAPIPGITRDFIVTRGTVQYFGTPDLDAGLDIEARYVVRPVDETDDLTIIARIGGTLLVPRLTLEAEQRQYSQSELISYLLFGQRDPLGASSAGGQAPGQRQELVRSALGTVFGELERTLVSDLGVPLDYLEIRPQARMGDPSTTLAGAQLAAGVQIGDRTFLGVKAGFCGGDPKIFTVDRIGASLQFRITPEWRLESSFEPFGCSAANVTINQNPMRQFGFDLLWEHRY